jgi:hypothetical protein
MWNSEAIAQTIAKFLKAELSLNGNCERFAEYRVGGA